MKKTYFGKVCARHPELRGERSASGNCTACKREYSRKRHEENPEKKRESDRKRREENPEKKRESDRKWREANPEKTREHHRKYYVKNRELIKQRTRQWREQNQEKALERDRKRREENKEKIAERKHEWYVANREKMQERNRKYSEENRERISKCGRQYYEENRELIKQRTRQWRKANPEKHAAFSAKRHALEYSATPDLTAAEHAQTAAIYAAARQLRDLTGDAYHVDHITALSKGGLHHPSNLRVVRAKDNLRKSARPAHEVPVVFEWRPKQ